MHSETFRLGNHPSRHHKERDDAALLTQEGNSPAFTVTNILCGKSPTPIHRRARGRSEHSRATLSVAPAPVRVPRDTAAYCCRELPGNWRRRRDTGYPKACWLPRPTASGIPADVGLPDPLNMPPANPTLRGTPAEYFVDTAARPPAFRLPRTSLPSSALRH